MNGRKNRKCVPQGTSRLREKKNLHRERLKESPAAAVVMKLRPGKEKRMRVQ